METAPSLANLGAMGSSGTVVDRGLEGVIVGSTALSDVDGAAGHLRYRGYEIDDLAIHASFEEVVHLLLFGALPTTHQLADLGVRLAANRALPPAVLGMMREIPIGAWPMDVLRTAVSALALFAPHQENGSHLSTPRTAIGLIAKTPTIVAAWDRLRRGLQPIDPLPHLGMAANFLYMRTGRMPIPEAERALDAYFVLLADHSHDTSTFAARVTASTRADIFAAATAALATLEGDLHGGAPGRVMEMLLAIGKPADAAAYVAELLASGERIVGMGHGEYRVRDPRAKHLDLLSRDLCEATNATWHAVARALEDAASAELARANPDRPLAANVEFYSAPTLYALGIPADEFTCLFACSRMAGWTAHVLEQLADNRLIRPQATYAGRAPAAYVPIERRATAPELERKR
jgi:citrate synthase